MVAQRITFESIMKEGGVLKIDINEEMIEYVHRSNGEYKATFKTVDARLKVKRDVQRESG